MVLLLQQLLQLSAVAVVVLDFENQIVQPLMGDEYRLFHHRAYFDVFCDQ
jgi:hypothetical protein